MWGRKGEEEAQSWSAEGQERRGRGEGGGRSSVVGGGDSLLIIAVFRRNIEGRGRRSGGGDRGAEARCQLAMLQRDGGGGMWRRETLC